MLGLSASAIAERKAAALTATLLHLDQPLLFADGGEGTLGDSVADRDPIGHPEAAIEDKEERGTLRTALEHLPEVQREVVQRYFFDGELLRDIADSLGVTEARVSQVCTEALNALRAYFQTSFEGVTKVSDRAPGVRQRAAFISAVSSQSDWRSRLEAGAGEALLGDSISA
jgi:RNA polymerase sigma factor FliA